MSYIHSLVLYCVACVVFFAVTACAPHSAQLVSQQATDATLEWPSASVPAPNPQVESRIDDLIERMTLEEKIGQMMQAEIGSATPEDVRRYHLGSVLNGGGSFPDGNKKSTVKDWLDLADAYYHASMDESDEGVAIPILWGTDAVHGHNNVFGATLYPHNIGLGATRNAELVREIGAATAKEVVVTGINWNFSPTLAVVRDDRWGRTYEGYSEDPALVASMGAAMVEGIQGAGHSQYGDGHILATAKHFIADGGTDRGDDQGDAKISEAELLAIHAPGYYSALNAGAETVMASYSAWNGKRMHEHTYLLTDVLKHKMGFDGFVLSDWNAIGHVKGCTNDDCTQAVLAGVDMLMVPGREDWQAVYANLLRDAISGKLPVARIDDAVRRILRVKLRAKLFARGAPSTRIFAGQSELIGADGHRALARQAVRESLVLLKNNDQVLPLSPKQKVWVGGSGSELMRKQVGGWSLTWQASDHDNADYPGSTLIADAIRSRVQLAGGELAPMDRAQVAIVVMADEPYAERYGDKENLDTLEFQQGTKKDLALLASLKKRGVKTVSIMLTGRPQWVNKELNQSDAFVVAWLPGSEGAGVADVLFASTPKEPDFDFVGTLSYSWPKHPCQTSVNVGDAQYDPLFPYGYGLRYKDKTNLDALPEQNDFPNGCHLAETNDALTLKEISVDLSKPEWQLEVGIYSGRRTALDVGDKKLGVARLDSEDTKIQWSERAPGRIAFRSSDFKDLIPYLAAEGNLSFVLVKHQQGAVSVGMECGHICDGLLEFGPVLAKLKANKPYSVSIPLSCFVGKPAIVDFAKVSAPLIVESNDNASMSISDVKISATTKGSSAANAVSLTPDMFAKKDSSLAQCFSVRKL